jgi:hypothetical protein
MSISATASSGTDIGGRPLSAKARAKLVVRDLIAKAGGNVAPSAAERIRQLAALSVEISTRAESLNPPTPLAEIVELLRLVELVDELVSRVVASDNAVTTINTGNTGADA